MASKLELNHEPYSSPNFIQSAAGDLWKQELEHSTSAPLICYLEKKLNCTGFTQPCCTSMDAQSCAPSDQCLPFGACDAISMTPCIQAIVHKTSPYDYIVVGWSGGVALIALLGLILAACQ